MLSVKAKHQPLEQPREVARNRYAGPFRTAHLQPAHQNGPNWADPLRAELGAAQGSTRGGGAIVTVISLLTMLSVLNSTLITTPRILLGLSRDGLGLEQAAMVSESGTPRLALGLSSVMAALRILTGTFARIIALAAVVFMFPYISAYAAVLVLRRREPALLRPYRALGFPYSTAVVLLGSVLFLVAAVAGDPRSAIIVAALLVASAPAYALVKRRQRVARVD